jgi:hypothetical protein
MFFSTNFTGVELMTHQMEMRTTKVGDVPCDNYGELHSGQTEDLISIRTQSSRVHKTEVSTHGTRSI